MEILYILSFLIFFVGLLLFIINAILIDKRLNLKKRNKPKDVCVLIPARYESKVIGSLLESISLSKYKINMKDVYVIVESSEDETCKICKEYGASVFIREKLELKRKGYALMEVIDHICSKNKYYDMYFVFDADNTIDKDFIGNMVNSYKEGYDIAIGNRKSSNINSNWVSVCSALTFSLINTLTNKKRKFKRRNIIVSGTGYFITKDLIKEWGTFPFNTLTEDYELSLYSSFKEYKMDFVEDAIFYDEQPTSFKESIKQRTRWVKGYFSSRKKHKKELYIDLVNRSRFGEWIGIKSFILMLISILLILILEFISLIKSSYLVHLQNILFIFDFIYIVLWSISLSMIIKDRKNYNISFLSCIKGVFLNPIFLLSYVICLLKGLGNEVEWSRIEHTGISK